MTDAPTRHADEDAEILRALVRVEQLRTENGCRPYRCPTSRDVECCRIHSGFDVCCDQPDLHQPIDNVDTGSILTRITAAIDAAEQTAVAAGGDTHTGRWWVPDSEWDPAVVDGENEPVAYRESAPTPEQSRHIVRHCPNSVMDRIAADRRLLARHAPRPHGMGEPADRPGEYDEIGPVCERCGKPGEYGVIWPCDDVRDLAAVYGVEL
ncbi:DUF6221 family protein [Micromonospora sp. NPDC049891]|uniref:DUF6221 family protein n=1 Tax=Micromonospora sp. NPDC049891 TaxID=3155655 RepID=UPI003408AAE9